MEVEVIPRREFLDDVWDYRAGEHVTLIGMTQSGKTTLGFELLHRSISTDLPAIVMVMKPKDPVPEAWAKRMGLRKIDTWPPLDARGPGRALRKPRGWLLWPKMGDIRSDYDNLSMQFDSALSESYAQAARRRGAQERILFVDEVLGFVKDLGLERELSAVWTRGSSMGLGLWAAGQRPFNMPLHAYNAASHLFLHKDPDERNIQRYKEIGGVSPDVVADVTRQLRLHEFLYIRRRDYSMAVIGAD
jgi:hypothetical protein